MTFFATFGGFAAIGVTCAAEAASVPVALHNKTISIEYIATAKNAVSDRGATSKPRTVSTTIYVSTLGRIFAKTEGRIGRDARDRAGRPRANCGLFSF
jgi:hypothetical protein